MVTRVPLALHPDREVPYTTDAGNALRSSSSMSLPRPLDAPVTRMTFGVSLDRGAGPNATSATSAGITTMSAPAKIDHAGAHARRGDDRLDALALEDRHERAGDVMDHHIGRCTTDEKLGGDVLGNVPRVEAVAGRPTLASEGF